MTGGEGIKRNDTREGGGREIINDRLEGETVEKREEEEEEERWIVVSTLGCHAMQGKKEVACLHGGRGLIYVM